MARFKNAPRKPAVSFFPATMSARAVTKNTEQSPLDHLFYLVNMSHQCHTRFCHYVTFDLGGA